jgi:ArsR family transcriptional regulator
MRDFLAIAKALGDENRVRTLMAVKDGELCLCQIIDLLQPLAPSTVSRHVSLLVQADLLELRKDGRWRFYGLPRGKTPPAIRDALRWALRSLTNNPVVVRDARVLRAVRKKDLGELSACYRS